MGIRGKVVIAFFCQAIEDIVQSFDRRLPISFDKSLRRRHQSGLQMDFYLR